MRKSFTDSEFSAEFKKIMRDDAVPVSGEELERAIRDLPREPDVIQLYNKMGPGSSAISMNRGTKYLDQIFTYGIDPISIHEMSK